MNFLLSATTIINAAEEAPLATSSNDIIGIGGIIATLVVGILTCLVTWKLTMRSIKQMKISYYIHIYPILSNSVEKYPGWYSDDFTIKYKEKILHNPCLLTLEVVNTGTESIKNPLIKIKSDENIEIIPGYFEDVPPGYEKLWTFNKDTQHSCSLKLEHINPKQVVKGLFFLDNYPQNKIIFECPMPNIQIQEVSNSNFKKTANIMAAHSKSNLIIIALSILLFVTIPQWSYYIEELIWITGLHLQAQFVVIFVMSILIMAVVLNVYGIPLVDAYLASHPKQSRLARLGLLAVSIILLVLITFDFIIIRPIPQIITAIIVAILLAFNIHFSSIVAGDGATLRPMK